MHFVLTRFYSAVDSVCTNTDSLRVSPWPTWLCREVAFTGELCSIRRHPCKFDAQVLPRSRRLFLPSIATYATSDAEWLSKILTYAEPSYRHGRHPSYAQTGNYVSEAPFKVNSSAGYNDC